MDNMRNCSSCQEREKPRMFPRDNCSSQDCDNWAIGMGYVPWQKMTNVYEPAQALRTGTLFPELEKPFMAHPMARKGARR